MKMIYWFKPQRNNMCLKMNMAEISYLLKFSDWMITLKWWKWPKVNIFLSRNHLQRSKILWGTRKAKETCLSMSIFLNLSHSPTLVMQNGESGTSSPVNQSPKSIPIYHMIKNEKVNGSYQSWPKVLAAFKVEHNN